MDFFYGKGLLEQAQALSLTHAKIEHVVIQAWHMTTSQALSMEAIYSATGTRTRVSRVRAEYPNQLDYSGCWLYHPEAPTP